MSGIGGVGTGEGPIVDRVGMEMPSLSDLSEAAAAAASAVDIPRSKQIGGSTGFRSGLLSESLKGIAAFIDGGEQAIDHAADGFQAGLTKAAENPETFGAMLKQIFGDKIDDQALQRLTAAAKRGEFPLPENIRFVDAETLQGGDGAYSPKDGGTIYLSRAIQDDPERLLAALTEEAGHHLDQTLGGWDTKGDEGEMFQLALKNGGPLNPELIKGITQEIDSGRIEVDGAEVDVEFRGTVEGYGGPAGYLDKQRLITSGDATKVNRWFSKKLEGLRTAWKGDEFKIDTHEKPLAEELTKLTRSKDFAKMLSRTNSKERAKLVQFVRDLEGFWSGTDDDWESDTASAISDFKAKVFSAYGKDIEDAKITLSSMWTTTLRSAAARNEGAIDVAKAIKTFQLAEAGTLGKGLVKAATTKLLDKALDALPGGGALKKSADAYAWLKDKIVDNGGVVGAITNRAGQTSVTVIDTKRGTVSTMIFEPETGRGTELTADIQGKIGWGLETKNLTNIQLRDI